MILISNYRMTLLRISFYYRASIIVYNKVLFAVNVNYDI